VKRVLIVLTVGQWSRCW